MFPLPQFSGRLVGVLGLGPGGVALAKALEESGAEVVGYDNDRILRSRSPIPCLRPEEWAVNDMAAIILADGNRLGLSADLVQRADQAGVAVHTDLELFGDGIAKCEGRDRPTVIAVTGAAGKSVTVSILAHILKDMGREIAIGGDLGQPLMALPAPTKGLIYVLELPVRRLSTTQTFRADISIALNVAGHTAPEQVELALRSLLNVFNGQGPEDTAIIGVDDILGQKVCTLLRSRQVNAARMGTIIPVSGEATLGHGIFALNGTAYSVHKRKTQTLGDFSRAPAFIGPHFNQDAAAAIAACLSLDIPPQMIIKALHSYPGLTGRFECLGAAGPVMFVDDSYASCTSAAQRAIHACLDVFWIGGDIRAAEGGRDSHSSLASVHGAYLLGTPDQQTDYPEGLNVARHQKLEEAFAAAFRDARRLADKDPGAAPVVLFSPGVPGLKTGFNSPDFRTLANAFIEEEARYA